MELLQALDRFLAENVKGVSVDARAVLAHVIRPPSYYGVPPRIAEPREARCCSSRWPPPGLNPYYLDVGAFQVALDNALKDVVAGYVAQLRQSGQILFTNAWQYAKRSARWQRAVDAGCADACGKREQAHDRYGHDGALTR